MSHYLIQQIAAIAQHRGAHRHRSSRPRTATDHLEQLTLRDVTERADRTRRRAVAVRVHRRGPAHRLAGRHGAARRARLRPRRPRPDRRTGGRPAGWELDRPPYHLETSVPGVFVAGDVRAESAKRVASAVGEGAMAVMLVHRYLEQSMTRRPADAVRHRTSCSTLFLFEKLDPRPAGAAVPATAGVRAVSSRRPGLRRGRPGDLLLRAARRHGRAVPPGRRGRRRDQPHLPARGVRRRHAGLPRATGCRRSTTTRCGSPSRRGSSCCPPTTFARGHAASGSRWRCTCWRGCSSASQNTQRAIGQRERLLALGSLSAGLTHELNNPAAAAVRATAALRERVAGDAAQARP